MLPILPTARLLLHPAKPDDLDEIWTLWADAEVRRYLFDDVPVTRERAEGILNESIRLAGEGLGLWTVTVRENESANPAPLRGCVGLLPSTTTAQYDPRLVGATEPLAAFAPSAWHKGYATEALEAVITYAFGGLGLKTLAAANDVPNEASDRLLRRLGFQPVGECDGPFYRMRTYTLTPDTFARRALWQG